MRYGLIVFWVVVTSGTLVAQGGKAIDKQLADVLREVHDTGADLYNNGDAIGCYRMFQGCLVVTKGVLNHHPELQRIITDGVAEAEKQNSITKRAFALHELIEKVRKQLRDGDALKIPPREVPPETKPIAKVAEVTKGIVGRVIWKGQPLEGVEITFVSLGRLQPVVYDAVSGSQGAYTLADITPGKYVVMIVPGPKSEVKKLPERYSSTMTSPLTLEVKGQGEKLDFVLQ